MNLCCRLFRSRSFQTPSLTHSPSCCCTRSRRLRTKASAVSPLRWVQPFPTVKPVPPSVRSPLSWIVLSRVGRLKQIETPPMASTKRRKPSRSTSTKCWSPISKWPSTVSMSRAALVCGDESRLYALLILAIESVLAMGTSRSRGIDTTAAVPSFRRRRIMIVSAR